MSTVETKQQQADTSDATSTTTTTTLTKEEQLQKEELEATKNRNAWIPVLLLGAFLGICHVHGNIIDAYLFMVLGFVFLRVFLVTAMQSLFFKGGPLRFIGTPIDDRDYDVEQFDREHNIWPSILMCATEGYIYCMMGIVPDPRTMPWCTWESAGIMLVAHVLPVELLYYWAHRIMHEYPGLYAAVHKHHHLSIVPTPKSAVCFDMWEHVFYDLLFGLPGLLCLMLGHATLFSSVLYGPLVDFANTLIHTNLEVFPKWYIDSPLYYLFYCPSYHHVHHKYFKYNYALFMPMYDMMFGTYSEKFTKKEFHTSKAKKQQKSL